MAKIIDEQKANSKETISRADYEYFRDQTFSNLTIIVGAISIYATFAFITIKFLKSKE